LIPDWLWPRRTGCKTKQEIARERYTKVIQNIETRCLCGLLAGAWEYQKLKAGNKDVLEKADQQIRNLNNAIDKIFFQPMRAAIKYRKSKIENATCRI
jgi:hypothetical protein